MSMESSRTGVRRLDRRTLILTMMTLAALLAVTLSPTPAQALGQPLAGFSEPAAGESFRVLDTGWAQRADMRFAASEVVRVNVTTNTVNWAANAAGGGALDLRLENHRGSILATAAFTQTVLGPVAQYTASLNLAPVGLPTDWYYLHVFIDDTASIFETKAAIIVGTPTAAHSIRTFTDRTLAVESDVFTRTSVVWVQVVGEAGADRDRWDLFEFVDRRSPVGGPRGGFPNFAAAGNVYTFSIDLSPFAATLVNGWYYTFEVRLAPPGSFLAGTQLQIFDPTLTIAGRDLAPPTAAQGQTGVAMLGLNLTLNAGWDLTRGPAAFNLQRLRFTRTGLGANADIAGIKVFRDANGDGRIDGGEPLLASAFNLAGIAFPAWVGQAGVTMATIPSGGVLSLIVAYDFSPFATPGNLNGIRLTGPADVGVHGSFVAVMGLPAASSNTQITGSPVTAVTNNPGIAPGASPRGQTVTLDLLALRTNGGVATLDALAVNLTGTAVPADVAQARVHADNGDGAFDPLVDPSLASAAFPATGPAWFRNLNFGFGAAARSVWIVYDLSPTATLGASAGSEITQPSSVVVSGGSVFSGGFALRSGLVTITGPVLRVADTDLAALAPGLQVRQGRTNTPMLQLNFTAAGGQATITGIRVDKVGTSIADGDLSMAKAWLDTGNNAFDIGDQLLGARGFVGGTTVIGGFAVSVAGASWRNVFVTFDVSPTATLGRTVGARLADATYIAVDANTTVDPGPFAIASTNLLIVAGGPGALVSVSSTDLAAGLAQVFRGQTNVPMLRLTLTADANAATIGGLRVDKTGTSVADGDIVALALWEDANGDGVWSAADSRLGSTAFVAGTAIFSGLTVRIVAGTPRTLFLTLDVAATAAVGQTIGVSLRNENFIAVDVNSSVDPVAFPHRSSNVPIGAEPLGSISGTVSDANGSPIAGATVTLVGTGRTATTDAFGAYRFTNLAIGSYEVEVTSPGFQARRTPTTLTVAEPDKVVNFGLTRPTGGLEVILGIGVALAALLLLLFLLAARRRTRCPTCGKPKPRDRPVCAECAAKGWAPTPPSGTVPPPP